MSVLSLRYRGAHIHRTNTGFARPASLEQVHARPRVRCNIGPVAPVCVEEDGILTSGAKTIHGQHLTIPEHRRSAYPVLFSHAGSQ